MNVYDMNIRKHMKIVYIYIIISILYYYIYVTVFYFYILILLYYYIRGLNHVH